jgi:hypothetical protein
MHIKRRISSIFAFAVWVGVSGNAQQFTDSTFNNTGWSTLLLPSSSVNARCTASQDAADGQPAPSRKTTHVYQQGWVNCAHLSLMSSYDPANGAIVSLRYSYLARHYTSTLGGVRYSPLVFQDNTYYYVAPGDDVRPDQWSNFLRNGLTETNFTKLDGPSKRITPDFSCRGRRIQFGYVTRNHQIGNDTITTESGIDDWQINVETQPCANECASPRMPKIVDGKRYCCDPDAGVGGRDFCCEPACPPGSVLTTVEGVTFCCQSTPQGELCCTPLATRSPVSSVKKNR